ncbi:MAG: hypothetical protein IT303_05935 [Dehalococcoidia bacterium]|nr:hypothetical protein [Dehalococcoidia bacterium]
MYIQVLTFRTSESAAPAAGSIAGVLDAAIPTYPGLATHRFLEDSAENRVELLIVWHDRLSMERFRHSDLFAWVSMDPRWDDVDEKSFAFEAPAPRSLAEIIGIAA